MTQKKYVVKDNGTRESFSEGGAVRQVSAGKGRYDLIPPMVIKRDAQLYESGAKAYDENNWTKGIPSTRFFESAKRHLDDYLLTRDEDNLAAARWNIAGIMYNEYMAEQGDWPWHDMDGQWPFDRYNPEEDACQKKKAAKKKAAKKK